MASDPAAPASDPAPASQNPTDMLRSRGYLVLLVFGAIVGVPVAVVAYFFLKLVALGQKYFFTTFPGELGFHGAPPWWPVPLVAVGGLLVALTLHYLPGTGGHNPAEGFKPGGTAAARDLPAIICAALATLIFGAVLGPEAPLIAIGAGLAALFVRLVKKDAPTQAVHGNRRRRELRRHIHAAGQSAGGGVPAAGGGGHRWRPDQRGACPGAAGGRDRRAHLRRPGQPDRIRDFLPRHPPHPGRHHPDRRRVPVGDRDRPGRGGRRHRHPPPGPAAAADRRASQGR